ncbi:hypothetical protein DQ04_02111020 [Trypanosoma grayi]|uniref:hypothetical protein n=1 Tax=Trypanosoma grayi TaxID=71804 RepID=UPI0004F46263|nr:hypothetical protein DQ04_02111020 [Trypanosoma grayi]KEG11960.1 hypothetical protein DQ04_02111020 [Trypanosoma grayi]
MAGAAEDLRALQARVEYVERRERERERDLHEQLEGVQRELVQTRNAVDAKERVCLEEMARMQREWQAASAAATAAQKQAEGIWRDLMVEERQRLEQAQQQQERGRFDAIRRVVDSLAEQVTQLSELVAASAAGGQGAAQQQKQWMQRHQQEQADFLKFFEETCAQLHDAIRREQQAREKSTRHIEQLLLARDGGGGGGLAVPAKIHHF